MSDTLMPPQHPSSPASEVILRELRRTPARYFREAAFFHLIYSLKSMNDNNSLFGYLAQLPDELIMGILSFLPDPYEMIFDEQNEAVWEACVTHLLKKK